MHEWPRSFRFCICYGLLSVGCSFNRRSVYKISAQPRVLCAHRGKGVGDVATNPSLIVAAAADSENAFVLGLIRSCIDRRRRVHPHRGLHGHQGSAATVSGLNSVVDVRNGVAGAPSPFASD